MKRISLLTVQMVNFRSFVQPTTIDLSANPGLKLFSGENQSEPRLGANGAGKSTIWDAVCYCLYGYSIKGLRASDLMTHNQKTMNVAVILRIDEEEYYINRTSPPERVLVNENRVEQKDLDQLLGLSRTRFLNSVIFGQGIPLFIDLPVPARGDLLDDVLDLAFWMHAADKAVTRFNGITRELGQHREAIARTEGGISEVTERADLQEQAELWEKTKAERIETLLTSFAALESEHQTLKQQCEVTREIVDEAAAKNDYESLHNRVAGFRQEEAVLLAELTRLNKEGTFFIDNENCPTCKQPITIEQAAEHLEHLREHVTATDAKLERVRLNIQTESDQANALRITYEAAVRHNAAIEREEASLKAQLAEKEREMNAAEQRLSQVSEEGNPYQAQIESAAVREAALQAELAEQKQIEQNMVGKLAAVDFWRQGFRRVRLFCIKRVLQQLEVETASAAWALGLLGWRVAFTTETETRSGTIRSGVQVEVFSPATTGKFDAWSGGEGQRVRLCSALGLAGLIQRWSGVRWDIEVWDEPSAWLSESGIEDLLVCLQARAEQQNKSLWVCDHRALIYSGFSEIRKVVKDAQGSRIE